ncbi:hypothetical protein PPERSA_02381 [Pseudocohnilembus persalinus]|uniref:FMR1-interacting protein 1 conserved domain-containing protein n=1 Tax=Pseudocohnilembus persalinus TaxID=266149 RepID=A0A0V0Q8L2_PSEPJ|nr:hypothetical protein PPERSA_02381 [Pseudocohnilembus persalinus]|eukprot:KRW98573.1 hypothetical protein PPERSA_02381 [Pseudocohnilembus persalinus]
MSQNNYNNQTFDLFQMLQPSRILSQAKSNIQQNQNQTNEPNTLQLPKPPNFASNINQQQQQNQIQQPNFLAQLNPNNMPNFLAPDFKQQMQQLQPKNQPLDLLNPQLFSNNQKNNNTPNKNNSYNNFNMQNQYQNQMNKNFSGRKNRNDDYAFNQDDSDIDDEEKLYQQNLKKQGQVQESQEEIKKWLEQRKKNYPTLQTQIKKKKQKKNLDKSGQYAELSLLEIKLRKKLSILNADSRALRKIEVKQRQLDMIKKNYQEGVKIKNVVNLTKIKQKVYEAKSRAKTEINLQQKQIINAADLDPAQFQKKVKQCIKSKLKLQQKQKLQLQYIQDNNLIQDQSNIFVTDQLKNNENDQEMEEEEDDDEDMPEEIPIKSSKKQYEYEQDQNQNQNQDQIQKQQQQQNENEIKTEKENKSKQEKQDNQKKNSGGKLSQPDIKERVSQMVKQLKEKQQQYDNSLQHMFNYKENQSNFKYKTNQLLSSYLAEEIYKERIAILQAIRYIVSHEFLQNPDLMDKSDEEEDDEDDDEEEELSQNCQKENLQNSQEIQESQQKDNQQNTYNKDQVQSQIIDNFEKIEEKQLVQEEKIQGIDQYALQEYDKLFQNLENQQKDQENEEQEDV